MKKTIFFIEAFCTIFFTDIAKSMDKNPPLCTLSAFYMWACERPNRENKLFLIEYIQKLNTSKKINITPIDHSSSTEDVIASAEKLLDFCHNCKHSLINGIIVEQAHCLAHAIAKK